MLAVRIPLRDSAGDLLGHIGTVVDVTAHKRAEMELEQSKQEYQLAFESDALAKAQLDLTTARFLRVNERLCDLTGYTQDELLERSFLDLTHPDDRESELEALLDMIAGREIHFRREKRDAAQRRSRDLGVARRQSHFRRRNGPPAHDRHDSGHHRANNSNRLRPWRPPGCATWPKPTS